MLGVRRRAPIPHNVIGWHGIPREWPFLSKAGATLPHAPAGMLHRVVGRQQKRLLVFGTTQGEFSSI